MPYAAESCRPTSTFSTTSCAFATSWGARASVALEPKSVAEFYAEVLVALRALGVHARIWGTPVEVADPIPFEEDRFHAAYDPSAAQAFWRT